MTEKKTSNVTALPTNVTFDLDAEEREEVDPFIVNIDGRAITMIDPETIDWMDLAMVGDNPVGLMRYALEQEDRDYVYGLRLPGWKLGRLMNEYMKHYKVEEKYHAAQRQRAGQGF